MPTDFGEKVPVIVHEFPLGIMVQLFVWLKSEALVPVMVIKLTIRSVVPAFLTVIVFGVDMLPTATFPKVTEMGETEILGGFTPGGVIKAP